jgi:hypothetical protein
MVGKKDFEIFSFFFETFELIGKQFEVLERKEKFDIVERILDMKIDEFPQAYVRVQDLEAEKGYLFRRMKMMIDLRFLLLGLDKTTDQGVAYFHEAIEKLKDLQDTKNLNPKLVLDSYASLIKEKLSQKQDWRELDPWMDLIWKMKKLFDYNLSSEIACAECCYSVVVNRFIQNKKFEAGPSKESSDICDVILWIHEKIHKDLLRLEHSKNVLIDVALDYVQELDNKEVLMGKNERVYLERILNILETIGKVGFEEKTEHFFIEKKFNDKVEYFKNVTSGVTNPEPIDNRKFFGETTIVECLQIDEDIRKGWKFSTKNEKKYFIKFYIERNVKLERRVKIESDFYKFLSEKKDFYIRYFGKYSEQLPNHKEHGIILEHSTRTLKTELDMRKELKNPFNYSQLMNLALVLLTILADLHSSPPVNPLPSLSHLDIRPENIILTDQNTWKLSNFNLFLQLPFLLSESYISLLPQDYMSPELQSSCNSLTFHFTPSECDIFSLSKTLLTVESHSSSKFPSDFKSLLLKGTSPSSKDRPSSEHLRFHLLPHLP